MSSGVAWNNTWQIMYNWIMHWPIRRHRFYAADCDLYKKKGPLVNFMWKFLLFVRSNNNIQPPTTTIGYLMALIVFGPENDQLLKSKLSLCSTF